MAGFRPYPVLRAAVLGLAIGLGAASLSASGAHAFSIDIVELETTGCTIDPFYSHCFGATVEIGLRISNLDGERIEGLEISAQEWSFVALFAGGTRAQTPGGFAQILSPDCLPGLGCVGGLVDTGDPAMTQTFGPGGPRVVLFDGVSDPFAGPLGDGTQDPGFDGVVGGGDAQLRLSFQIAEPGYQAMTISATGVLPATLDLSRATRQIVLSSEVPAFVVPEPSMALLLGVGLSALAVMRSRRR